MTAGYEESNGSWNSQHHNWLLRISPELFTWAATVFQGARSSCARWGGTLIFAVALGAIPSVLSATEGAYTYSVDNQKATITKYNGPGGDVVIPNSLNGYPVASIANEAFRDCTSLISVVIPDSLTSIGDAAFYRCSSLTSVEIPDGVTSIENFAFAGCNKLTSVVIPDSVTSIGESAFHGCSSLTSVVISANVTSIGESAFFYCSRLTSVVIPDSVTSIGDSAFSGCSSLASVMLPDSVTNIGEYAFLGCHSLTNVVIPASVTRVGEGAFRECSTLVDITVASANSVYSSAEGVFFNKNKTIIIQCPAKKSDNYQIPDSVISIMDFAFSGCSNLVSVVISDGVTNIGDYAFLGCSNLTNIMIGAGVTSIRHSAFYGCSSLTSVVIPDSVTYIGENAFSYCSRLTSVVIPDNVTSIGERTFSGCSGLISAVIGDGVTNIGNYAFNDCSSLTSVVIPDSVTSIGNNAFYNCSRLASVVIPNGVTSIESGTFFGCSDLASVEIPDGLTSIGDAAFYRCSSLTSVVIPDGVTSIGSNAFSDCSNLISVVIRGAVTSIRERTFFGCSRLTSVVIPDSVTSIGKYAFYGCSGLSGIYFLGTPPSVWAYSNMNFYDVPGTVYYISGTVGWGTEYYGLPTAVWTSKATFAGNGGTPFFTSWNYKVGRVYDTLPTISRSGYVFAGWWTSLDEGGTEINTSTLVPLITTGHTLYAKWTINQYTITFDSAGGTPIADITQDYGTAVTAPVDPTRDGYTFAGWLPVVPETMPLNGLTCVAQWTSKQYMITFDANGGTSSVSEQNYIAGEVFAELPTASRPDYTFSGWWTSPDGGTQIAVDTLVPLPTLGYNLYAHWDLLPDHHSMTVPLHAGWNLICAMQNFTETSLQKLRDKRAMKLSQVENSYVLCDKLSVSEACWVFAPSDEEITLVGTSPENFDFEASLRPGWNFVGSLEDRSLIGSGAIAWGWDGQLFYPTNSLRGGSGYLLYWPGE